MSAVIGSDGAESAPLRQSVQMFRKRLFPRLFRVPSLLDDAAELNKRIIAKPN